MMEDVMADGAKTAAAGVFEAIVLAQAEARQIEKDARNQFHKYNYVSAEAMIHEGKELFSKYGLALVPVSADLSQAPPAPTGDQDWEKNSRAAMLLHTKWVLAHKDGSTMNIETAWPVAPEKGRPIDKAVAAARTASLSYLIRDLLQIPRVEEGTDLDGDDRDDNRQRQGPPAEDCRVLGSLISAALDEAGYVGDAARTNRVNKIHKRPPNRDSAKELDAVLSDLKRELAAKVK